MRKLFIYMVIFVLCSCEVIAEKDRYIPVDRTSDSRTHVLLDFTGFRCVNCPTATEIAGDLKEMYGSSLIVVSLHPASNPFTQGLYDYTCPAADSIYKWMGGTVSTPFPAGNLDIRPYEGDWFVNMREWATMVYQASSETTIPYLFCSCETDSANRTINAMVDYTLSIDARLALWLVEDSVQGVQAMPDGSINMEYMHRHMLRGAAYEAPFGIAVTGKIMNISMPIPAECDIKHLSIVALLLNPSNNHILQAYEKKLTDFSTLPNGNE